MKSTVAVLLLLGLVGVCFAGIDRGDCIQKRGDYGVTVECDPGYAAVVLCTSGRDADCGGYYTELTCCRETGTNRAARACTTREGDHGVPVNCDNGYLVRAVCSSGRDADCGVQNVYTRIMCCNDHLQEIDNSLCLWRFGDYGEKVECGLTEVMTAVCSSGRDADCSGEYTGIQCCVVKT